MGVEPTRNGEGRRATVLKTARSTGTRTPPWMALSEKFPDLITPFSYPIRTLLSLFIPNFTSIGCRTPILSHKRIHLFDLFDCLPLHGEGSIDLQIALVLTVE
jgi:hypothetical protein